VSVPSFEDLVESSITETLSKVLGQLVWKAIGFYFEPKRLSRDPDALPEVLGKLFGKNANVLERVIAEDLLTRVGAPQENRRGSDFRTYIRIAKARFISSTSSLAHPANPVV
jgi:hypothetical protein